VTSPAGHSPKNRSSPSQNRTQYVLDQRLALAYHRLRHPRFAGRTVSSIAHDAGFGDLSYFNRTFRRRYSVTPSDVRRRAGYRGGSAGPFGI
jgi:AraC-like DNA-binding protein